MGLQTEVPSKDTPLVTQGSQITKLVTMDFMEAGIPIDFKLKDKEGNVIEDINERFVAWNAIKTEAEYLISTDLSCLMHIEGRLKFNGQNLKIMHLADILASGY
jgi:Fe-S oxidoreductase